MSTLFAMPCPACKGAKTRWNPRAGEEITCNVCSGTGEESDPTKLPDPGRTMAGRFHFDGPDTERAAAKRMQPRSGTQRLAVLDALRSAGEDGCTDYELWSVHKIGARPHVPGTRREELIADGWPIRDSQKRRPTDTGAAAIVWRFADDGAAA